MDASQVSSMSTAHGKAEAHQENLGLVRHGLCRVVLLERRARLLLLLELLRSLGRERETARAITPCPPSTRRARVRVFCLFLCVYFLNLISF